MEKARGISITSAALQFVYRDHVVNLVDTPGHSDFSEDTYRVLSAVDSAVMLVDAGKGIEPQTLKLFEVCALRGIPVITVINKWDRPGLSALELMDLIEQQIELRPHPADLAGRRGRRLPRRARPADRRVREVHPHRRRRHPRPEERMPATDVDAERPAGLAGRASRSTSCSTPTTPTTTRSGSWPARRRRSCSPPPCRTSASRRLLDLLLDLAPAPGPTRGRRRLGAPARGRRSARFVFKVQSGMNAAHRDRLAFARVVLRATFERGMVVTHASTGRPFATKYAQAVFGRELSSIEHASPGDIIGLVNAQALRVGDTLYVGDPIEYPPVPSFAPEHFMTAAAADVGRLQAVPQGHRRSSTRRAWSRCCGIQAASYPWHFRVHFRVFAARPRALESGARQTSTRGS